MKRQWVDSTTVALIAYDEKTHELEIVFRESGDIYVYSEVLAEEYEEFLAADSKGTYLNTILKPRGHAYRVVRKGGCWVTSSPGFPE